MERRRGEVYISREVVRIIYFLEFEVGRVGFIAREVE